MVGDRKLDPKTDYNGVFADPAAFAKKVHCCGSASAPKSRRECARAVATSCSTGGSGISMSSTNHQARIMNGRPGVGICKTSCRGSSDEWWLWQRVA